MLFYITRWLEICGRLRSFYKPNITTPTAIEKCMRLNRDDMKVGKGRLDEMSKQLTNIMPNLIMPFLYMFSRHVYPVSLANLSYPSFFYHTLPSVSRRISCPWRGSTASLSTSSARTTSTNCSSWPPISAMTTTSTEPTAF